MPETRIHTTTGPQREDPHCIEIIHFVEQVDLMLLALQSSDAKLQSMINAAQGTMMSVRSKIDSLADDELNAQAPTIVGMLKYLVTEFANHIQGEGLRERVLQTLVALPAEYVNVAATVENNRRH